MKVTLDRSTTALVVASDPVAINALDYRSRAPTRVIEVPVRCEPLSRRVVMQVTIVDMQPSIGFS